MERLSRWKKKVCPAVSQGSRFSNAASQMSASSHHIPVVAYQGPEVNIREFLENMNLASFQDNSHTIKPPA